MELEVCLLHVCSLKVRGGGGREVRERGERRGERGGGGVSHSLLVSIPTSLYFCRYSRRGSM